MKLLLVYPPFCTPTMMPYSISALKGILRANSDIDVKCLDLNAKFHAWRFKEHYSLLGNEELSSVLARFDKASRPVYAENNKLVVHGKEPELLKEMLEEIMKEGPTHVAFSIVYNSQNFYAKALIDHLKVPCFSGGPAVSTPVKERSAFFSDGGSFLSSLGVIVRSHPPPDFSDYDAKDYLAQKTIFPVKSSNGCAYKRCAFCTHHHGEDYKEYPIGPFIPGNAYFFIDDMITVKRMLEISSLMDGKGCSWFVQLRPGKEFIPHLKAFRESGLKCIAWGVESGSQDILDAMRKGTKKEDVEEVIKASHEAGIRNIVYIMFGFPGETKEKFLETIAFLKENADRIDLVSTTVFGLQKGSPAYADPAAFGITEIHEEKRTILDGKITFKGTGLSPEEANHLRKGYKKTIRGMNKFPDVFNYFKEQTLTWDG